jgi:hypothetical protein
MSLVDSDHITGTTGSRHGAHYYQKNINGKMVPCMTLYNEKPNYQDKICPKCLRTPFSNDEEICKRCGSKLE